MQPGRLFVGSLIALLALFPVSANTQTTSPNDVMLVLDNSGSMQQNDPNFLMRDVVSSFASELAPDSRLGLVLFEEKVNPALGLTGADAPDFKERVAESLTRIDYRGRWTDIPAGMERAIYELRQQGRPQARRFIILLTDGIVDLGSEARNLEQARWLRESLAQQARDQGIRIFGIAFTEAADFQLIQSLAQTTGGEYFRVLADSDIPATFDQIRTQLEAAVDAARQPGGEPDSIWNAIPAKWRPWLMVAAGLILLLLIAMIVMRRSNRAGAKARIPVAMLSELGSRSDEKAHPLKKVVTTIGRDEMTNDIVIPHDTVSSQHAIIEFRDGSFYLKDRRSANGTFLNGKKFSDTDAVREVALKHGDRIRFDAYEFEFVLAALESVPATALASTTGKTRLRPEPPAPVQPHPAVAPAPDEAALKTVAEGAEARTELKPDMCPNHPAWKATELCPECKKAKCKSCMTEKDGQAVCMECVKDVVP
ncbi:MAG: VWA domain-containing protein [Blastocatellia bacterium]|nr:VWA domain-containing protein [Blastocatellia bacterium]